MTEIWTREPVEDSETSTGYPVTEQTTGINFRAYSATFSRNYTSLRSYRTALSYVTGSHAHQGRDDPAGGTSDHRRLHQSRHRRSSSGTARRSR